VAEALRALASDYLARAANLHHQDSRLDDASALGGIRRHHGSDEQMFGAK